MRTGPLAVAVATLLAIALLPGCSGGDDTVAPPTGAPPCSDETGNRFVDCENGTITDSTTGLIWLTTGSCFERKTFDEATSEAAGLEDGECGLTDESTAGEWRLPTREEWTAIVKPGCEYGSPHLPDTADIDETCWSDGDPFVGAHPSGYWSSTEGSSTNFVWIVYLHDGYFIADRRSAVNYVWPVRSP